MEQNLKDKSEKIILFFLFTTALTLLFLTNFFITRDDEHFVYLAKSFQSGHLYFIQQPNSWHDTTLYKGHYFWPQGPLPALIISPFLFFGLNFIKQGYISFFLTLINILLVYKISLIFVKRQVNALWMSFAYIFATAYLPISFFTSSYYFAHSIATTILLMAILAYLKKLSWFWIGLLVGLGVATRNTLIFSVIFFLGIIFFKTSTWSLKILQTLKFVIPIIIIGLLLGVYNLSRFDNFFDSGYNNQILVHQELIFNRSIGLWNIQHIPANLYYFLLKSLDPVFLPNSRVLTFPYIKYDLWGTSILITSPIFLWLLKIRKPKIEIKLSLITASLMLLVVFGYYGIGFHQFGYRYALDAYPFLFLALIMTVNKDVTTIMKLVITISFLINSYLVLFSR